MTTSGEFAIFKAGKQLGRESFEVAPEEGGGTLARGRVTLDLPPDGFEQETELRLDAGLHPRRFTLDRRSGEDSARLVVTFQGATARLESVTKEGERREEMEVAPGLLVHGSNVFHQFSFFWLRYDQTRGGAQSFPLFPHRNVVMERKGDRRALLDGREETVAHLFVDLDGVLGIDLFFWRDRLVRVAVPLQRLEVVLEGIPGLTRETGFPPVAEVPAAAPSPFPEEEVRFASAEGITLAGTLTLPLSAPPWPGVVLVSGSGPQDRNGDTVGPGGVHFGFLRTLAYRLAAKGLAVLRYDERGVAASGGSFRTAGLFDLAADARAVLDYLATRPEVRSRRLGMAGHSEGGLIATLVAAVDSRLGAIAVLATLARPLDQILLHQFELLLARSVPAERREAAIERRRRTLETLKRTGDWEAPEVEEEVRRAIAPERRRWFAEHFALDPLDVVRRVRCAVGIFQGGRDVQLDSGEAELLARALDEAGHRDHTVGIFPQLDHFFMPSTGRGLSEYADESRRVDEEFLETLAGWLSAKLLPEPVTEPVRSGA